MSDYRDQYEQCRDFWQFHIDAIDRAIALNSDDQPRLALLADQKMFAQRMLLTLEEGF